MTIDRIRINGKYMEEKLKRGFGTNDFINHLNISEEEFFHCLKKTFSTKSYNLICKRIRNNEKKASKLSTKQTTDTEINTESQTVDLEVENCISPLDVLKTQEFELVKEICSIETEHSKLISKRATLKKEFQQQQNQLNDLIKKAESIRKNFETTFSEWEKLGSDMKSLTNLINDKNSSLESIRNEIISLQKISIFVYSNGEVISYNISRHPVFAQVVDMLKKAFSKIPDNTNLILHSDQGWQYQMKQYQHLLKEKGIRQSMSRKGNCLDNSLAENFFGLLKSELFYMKEYKTIEELETDIIEYIDYYNNKRIKGKLKGMSPVQYRVHSQAA